MLAGCHAAFVCITENDVDDVIEEECFAMLATEVLCRGGGVSYTGGPECMHSLGYTNTTEDVFLCGEMCLAVLAAVDAGW